MKKIATSAGLFPLYSNHFDNGNWCIGLCVSNKLWYSLHLLRWPFGISAIYATYSVTIQSASDKVYSGDKREWKWIEKDPCNKYSNPVACKGFSKINLSRDEFMNEEWINIKIEIEITDIFVEDKKIEPQKWSDYGFVF